MVTAVDVKHEQARASAALQKAEPLERRAGAAAAAGGGALVAHASAAAQAMAALAEKEAALNSNAQPLQLGQIDLRDKAERVKELQALLQAKPKCTAGRPPAPAHH